MLAVAGLSETIEDNEVRKCDGNGYQTQQQQRLQASGISTPVKSDEKESVVAELEQSDAGKNKCDAGIGTKTGTEDRIGIGNGIGSGFGNGIGSGIRNGNGNGNGNGIRKIEIKPEFKIEKKTEFRIGIGRDESDSSSAEEEDDGMPLSLIHI